MSKYMAIFDEHLSSTLIAKLIIKDHKYFIFTKNLFEVTFDLFQATPIIKLLPNNITLLNKPTLLID